MKPGVVVAQEVDLGKRTLAQRSLNRPRLLAVFTLKLRQREQPCALRSGLFLNHRRQVRMADP